MEATLEFYKKLGYKQRHVDIHVNKLFKVVQAVSFELSIGGIE